MNVLIWNVRGMNNIEKQRERRELIKKNKPSIVGLVETKVCETRSSRIAHRMKKGCDLMANYTSSPRGIILLL